MAFNPIKKRNIGGQEFVGIVTAEEYFEAEFNANRIPPSIRKTDLVVCKFSDFHDGEKSHFEAIQTVGILRDLDNAELIYRLTNQY